MPDMFDVTEEHTELNKKLREIAGYKNDIKTEKANYDLQMKGAGEAMSEVNPHSSVVAMFKERRQVLLNHQAEQGVIVLDAEKEVGVFESVAKVFSPAGVRAHILDTVTPFLNDRTGDYLSALSDGNISAVWNTLSKTAKGDLKEKFNIEVTNDTGADTFGGLSGGEKRKVRLASMLALQDLVASRATKPLNLYIADEIDAALDGAGLERLMGVLERKARERGTVLIISHNSLKDWCDQVLTITKKGGTSTASGALCL